MGLAKGEIIAFFALFDHAFGAKPAVFHFLVMVPKEHTPMTASGSWRIEEPILAESLIDK